MNMMKEDKQHFCSRMYSKLGTFLPVMVVLVISFFFFLSVSASFPVLLTILVALISTMFLVTLRKKKGSIDESLIQDKLQEEDLGPSLNVTQTEDYQQSGETAEDHEHQAEAQSEHSFHSDSESSNFSIMDKTFELNVQENEKQGDFHSDSSLPSDSESSAGSIMGESFEIDHNGYQNVCSSDSLAADTDTDTDDEDDDDDEEEEEDSLIEINLPRSHFSEDPKQKLESKLPDFRSESFFKQQQCLMELLAEINEMNDDENLIEIDISMGSTKSRDFQLKQEMPCLEDQCVLRD